MPRAGSLAERNERLTAADELDQTRRIAARSETIGQAATREAPAASSVAGRGVHDPDAVACRVDAKARICVRQSYYSVPAHLAGARVTVALGARDLQVRDARAGKPAVLVATHIRSMHKSTQDLVLHHYLEVLARRPGALPGATALVSARASGTFTAEHDAFWTAAHKAEGGDAAGTRALIEVLLLHRTLPREAVLAWITASLAQTRPDPAMVAVEARRFLERDRPRLSIVDTGPAGIERPAPTLTGYDSLVAVVPVSA